MASSSNPSPSKSPAVTTTPPRKFGSSTKYDFLGESAPTAKKAILRLNGYFAADFTDVAYQQAAFNKVLKGWKVTAPLPPAGKKTVVISTIGRDGALLGTKFNLKSGNEAFDAAAEAAVKSAAPFARFPVSYKQPTVEVHWHFEIEN